MMCRLFEKTISTKKFVCAVVQQQVADIQFCCWVFLTALRLSTSSFEHVQRSSHWFKAPHITFNRNLSLNWCAIRKPGRLYIRIEFRLLLLLLLTAIRSLLHSHKLCSAAHSRWMVCIVHLSYVMCVYIFCAFTHSTTVGSAASTEPNRLPQEETQTLTRTMLW